MQNPGLPSWVTDWTTPTDERLTLSRYWDHLFRYSWYACDNGVEMVLKVHGETSAVDLDGIFVDRIVTIGEPLMQDDQTNIHWPEIRLRIEEWRKLAGIDIQGVDEDKLQADHYREDPQAMPKEATPKSDPDLKSGLEAERHYITGERRFEAFWRTLIGNLILDASSMQPLREASPSDSNFYRALCGFENLPDSRGFDISLYSMLTNQGFFVSEKGYMGIVPGNVKKGDEIWVLFGSSVPFALRKSGSEDGNTIIGSGEDSMQGRGYIKLGDCYVHGIMQGEAVRGYEHKRTTITLC
jgi:hypothetical protein